MTRALISVLFVFVLASVSVAGIPDPDMSYVVLDDNGVGLSTCPAGDGPTFIGIIVYAMRADGTPIPDIASSNFSFEVTGTGSECLVLTAAMAATNEYGYIRFHAQGGCSIPWGDLTLVCTIYNITLNDSDTLTCNTVDYDDSGAVDPIDFSAFASDFGGVSQRSDFDWNGSVNPIDFSFFASHFGAH